MEVDEEMSIIVTEWKNYLPSAEYRASLLQVHELVKRYGLRFWLSDSRKMGAILRDDEQWSVAEFTPLLMQAGLRRIAVISSADYFNRTSTERMVEATAAIVPFKVEFFDDPLMGREWLAVELKVLA